MDTNALLHIARFADSQTIFQIIKAGGRSIYDDMKAMSMIQELDVDDAPCVSIIFFIPTQDNFKIISQIKKMFHVDKVFLEDDEYLHMYKMMWCDYCFIKEMKRSYADVANGTHKCLLLMSTKNKMSFLRSLKKFLDSEISYGMKFMNPLYHDRFHKEDTKKTSNIVLKFFRNKVIPVKNVFQDPLDPNGALYEIDIFKIYRIII